MWIGKTIFGAFIGEKLSSPCLRLDYFVFMCVVFCAREWVSEKVKTLQISFVNWVFDKLGIISWQKFFYYATWFFAFIFSFHWPNISRCTNVNMCELVRANETMPKHSLSLSMSVSPFSFNYLRSIYSYWRNPDRTKECEWKSKQKIDRTNSVWAKAVSPVWCSIFFPFVA